jgi:uncharacterized 2Fe-2S/4Fe-4S cluster protein (DUF4445 family)
VNSADTHRIILRPVGAELKAAAGTPLRDLLFEQGVEFPCGGNGRCRGCKVRILEGHAALNDAQREHLTPKEMADGWRLACQCSVEDDLVIELRQWDASILVDETGFTFTPQEGLGIAVDLGTTTLVAQLLDLQTGHVMAVKTALNPQARFGGDVMSRIQFAVAEKGQKELENVIRHEIGRLIHLLFVTSGADETRLKRVVLVGNTVMHHLFSGVDLEPLSHYPFEPVNDGLQTFTASELGWKVKAEPVAQFLPCLGGFVGSDILAGILATGLHESAEIAGLVDLGTNGEIVIGSQEGMLCASTAAGPAFEGARIEMGMRAATGAIWAVRANDGHLECDILGNGEARGICGSGLVDAVAAGLQVGLIQPAGRLNDGADRLPLSGSVALTQTDIRQLQLAKGAIAAGIRILMQQAGITADTLTRLSLAGAFGNYINRRSAQRIGLLQFPMEKVQPVGNTALLGAKLALFALDGDDRAYSAIRSKIRHISLNEDPQFMDIYVEEMSFPAE